MVYNIFTKMCCIIIVTFPLARARRYDLDSEAMKLYGEDISTLLKKFRRTPEYMKILEDKRRYMDIHLQEVAVQIMQRTENELSQNIAEMVGYTRGSTTTAPASSMLFNYKHLRRNDDGDTTQDPVRKLDAYHMLHRILNVHDRNHFRDLGYEMAGKMVHMIIKGMGPLRETATTADHIVLIEGDTPETTTERDLVDLHTHGAITSTPFTLAPTEETGSTVQDSFDTMKRKRPSF